MLQLRSLPCFHWQEYRPWQGSLRSIIYSLLPFKIITQALSIIAVLGSLVGVFYYFRVIVALFKEENETVIPVSGTFKTLLIVTSLAALALGVFPQLLTGLL